MTRNRIDINSILYAEGNARIAARRASGEHFRGSPMGARDIQESEQPLYVQRVRMVDGDYAPDGTYWGGGRGTAPLWCGFSADGETRIYVRASNRECACAVLSDDWDANFHKKS